MKARVGDVLGRVAAAVVKVALRVVMVGAVFIALSE
jgi:hypothetical protein